MSGQRKLGRKRLLVLFYELKIMKLLFYDRKTLFTKAQCKLRQKNWLISFYEAKNY